MNYREYWKDELQGVIECYSDEYAEEIGINKLTSQDMDELADIVMNNDYLWQTIDRELRDIIEDYCNRNK